ncbi:MAG TPA: inorganic diphosphatase [Chloroflexota bacterium]|nr:inorganic diphosphatase [Chloroflexota bacterium]
MVQEQHRQPIEVVIEAVGAEAYCYAYDAAAQALRLIGVAAAESGWPGDLGVLPDSLAPDAQPVQVLVLGRQPTFPGCRVAAYAIGLVEIGRGAERRSLVLAVPAADPAYAGLVHIDALPPAVRLALERAVEQEALALGNGALTVRWGDPAEAAAYVRAARQAYRLAQHSARTPRAPTWEGADRTLRRIAGLEAERHTEAEYTVYRLPYRFQQYARECLLPAERLLHCVLRRPVRHGRGWGLGRRQVAHEALLLVTDQQVLLLADALPPDSTLVHWGYVARAVALERVLEVAVRHESALVWLELVLATAAGPGQFRVEFAAEQEADCLAVAELVRRFCPPQNRQRLMRRYAVAAVEEALEAEAFVGPDTVASLEAQLRARLSPEEPVLARALAPGAGSARAQLLAATSWRVLAVATDPREPGWPAEVPLATVAAVELQNALTGGRFRLWLGERRAAAPLAVAFPYPVVGPFRHLFLVLRQLLATPPGAPAADAPAGMDTSRVRVPGFAHPREQ